jgi:hypothetical protein
MNFSKISIVVKGTWCNNWPRFKISGNNCIYFDDYVVENKVIEFFMPAHEHNTLILEHYGKQFGQNNQWDTLSKDGVIIQDRAIRLISLELDEVEISQYLTAHWPFKTDSGQILPTDYFGFNGYCCIEFNSPTYDWIITKLVHDPSSYTPNAHDLIIETSHNDLFNYDQDLITLSEIEQLLNKHAHLFNKSS